MTNQGNLTLSVVLHGGRGDLGVTGSAALRRSGARTAFRDRGNFGDVIGVRNRIQGATVEIVGNKQPGLRSRLGESIIGRALFFSRGLG